LVERSGQGVDKMFYQSIIESKEVPDYSQTDNFQVVLKLSGLVIDPAFVLFINALNKDEEIAPRLGVLEVITLNQIRQKTKKSELDSRIVSQLFDMGLIEKRGATNNLRYVLSKAYYQFTNQEGKYSNEADLTETRIIMLILDHLSNFGTASMKDFIQLFGGKLSRKQLNSRINKLLKEGALDRIGVGKGTAYRTGEKFIASMEVFQKAIDIGMKKLKDEGEL